MHNEPRADKDTTTTLKTKLLLRIGILGISVGIALAIGVTGAIFAAYHYAKPGLPEAATVR
ncbi:MAG: hypothetical protein AAAFM81_02730, partial [Pseudomonadota bacterium]